MLLSSVHQSFPLLLSIMIPDEPPNCCRVSNSPEGEKIRYIKQLKNRTMHTFISMTSDLIIIDQTSFPHERATVIDYFPFHKTPVAANPSLSSLAHTWLHRPNQHKINIILYTEHKNKMCRACTSTLHKKIWGCLNSTCYMKLSILRGISSAIRSEIAFYSPAGSSM